MMTSVNIRFPVFVLRHRAIEVSQPMPDQVKGRGRITPIFFSREDGKAAAEMSEGSKVREVESLSALRALLVRRARRGDTHVLIDAKMKDGVLWGIPAEIHIIAKGLPKSVEWGLTLWDMN